jgi:hypothetical protein
MVKMAFGDGGLLQMALSAENLPLVLPLGMGF